MVERTRWAAVLCLAACVACGNEAGLDLRDAGAGGAPPAESGAPTTGGGGGESTDGGPSTGGAPSTGGHNQTWSDAGMCFKPVATNGNEPFPDCPCVDLEIAVSGTACTNVGEVCRYDHDRRCWVASCECRVEASGKAVWWCPTLLC